MTIDQIIAAAKLWRNAKLNTAAIAKEMGLPEFVVYNNLWRICRVAAAEREAS
ncbi:MAG: hypothetical protein AB7R40_23795 [Nitrospiraceae bacterium]